MGRMKMAVIKFRCVPSFSLIFLVIIMTITFFFFSSASSLLSPAQKNTMILLSDSLQRQNSSISWNSSADPCSWAGVTCVRPANTNSSVSELSLSNIGLSDFDVLRIACQIDTLEALDVSKNQLSSIPEGFFTVCGGIEGLKRVDLSGNTISGSLPSFSDGFAKLESLDLSHNALTGSIVMQLNGLVALKSLNLSFNNFSGLIPINLGKSMALEQLQLSTNHFHGTIPEQLADYKNLTILDLSWNMISGNIPSAIGELLKLEVLVLSANKLSGEVPNFISNITTLQRFAAYQNYFTGVIPSGISRFLKNLDLSFNKLTGSIPDDLLMQPNLESVDLSSNGLVGSIPSNVSSSLLRLSLGNNSLTGSLLPVNFGELKNLKYLELGNNNLSGPIPSDLGSCQNLTLLNLAGNILSGGLPEELGNLKQLQELSLEQNNFGGKIPYEITQLSRLSTLNLSWNSLEGSIPPSISGLTNLTSLHLQGNKFSGSIPRSIGVINSLTELQLGNNHLRGDIPSMPTKLRYALNLSNNLFEGPIPNSLSQLGSLEILDLSNNRFSGEIPDSLTTMQSLTMLLLDNNDLSGVIPPFTNHVTVDINGNAGLIKPSSIDTNPELKHRKKPATLKIVVPIAALTGGLATLIVVFLSRKLLYRVSDVEEQREGEDIPDNPAVESRLLTTSSIHKSNIDFTKAKEAVADPLNFVLKTKFSRYYKVRMPSGKNYFVKKLNRSDIVFQLVGHENFGQELEALAKINSSSIMTPLAYMLATDGAYIFYEAAFKTTLFDVLHGSSAIPLDWASRCSIAVGVAQGLAYLHGRSSGPILLFDLTSRTIMLKSIKEPQIGDIELCKLIDPSKNTSSLSAVAGSIGYIPPEYAYTMKVTTAGNVYTFGVILLELVTGKEAVSQGTELAKWASNNSGQPQTWEQMLDFSISRTSQAVKSQMLAVLKIAFACINASSLVRPQMKSVLRMLLNAT